MVVNAAANMGAPTYAPRPVVHSSQICSAVVKAGVNSHLIFDKCNFYGVCACVGVIRGSCGGNIGWDCV